MKAICALLALTFSIAFYSCDKNEVDNNDFSNIITPRFTDYPTVVNGVLTFQNELAYKNYYSYLDSIASSSEDADSSLLLIENSLGHNSYRKDHYVTVLSERDFDDYVKGEYIHDIILQSIFNTDAEFSIGNYNYFYISKNGFYKIKNTDTETLNQFRTLPLGNTNPPIAYYNGSVQLISGGGIDLNIVSTEINPIIPRSPDVRINAHLDVPVGCIVGLNRTLNGILQIKIDGVWQEITGDWAIHWGDGDASFVSNSGTIQNEHLYLEPLDLEEMHIAVNYNHPTLGPETITTTFIIHVQQDCKSHDHHEDGRAEFGNWRMVTKIWYTYGTFSNHIDASSHAWRKNNSGDWDRKKAKMNVWVEIDWNLQGQNGVYSLCHDGPYEEEPDQCNNCKRLKAQKWQDIGTWFDDNPNSTHRLEKDNVILTSALRLNECD